MVHTGLVPTGDLVFQYGEENRLNTHQIYTFFLHAFFFFLRNCINLKIIGAIRPSLSVNLRLSSRYEPIDHNVCNVFFFELLRKLKSTRISFTFFFLISVCVFIEFNKIIILLN